MTFQLHIDKREKKILSLHVLSNAVEKQLDIGDFLIVRSEDEQPVLIIERKTLMDLSASIKDGRYMEQKCRAMSLSRFMYICEVGDDFRWAGEDKQVRSAILNTMLRDGIPVFFCRDASETCVLVQNIFDKITQKGEAYFDRCISVSSTPYKACFKKRRDNANTPRIVTELQLSQIPSVSINNAIAILDAFKANTMLALMAAIRSNENVKKTLMDIDGIGKKKADVLIAYLCET